jgi:peptidyl-prolyl cis-trans isomerase SurA
MRGLWVLGIGVALLGGCRGEDGAEKASTQAAPVGLIDGQPIARADFVDALITAQGDAFFDRYVERRLIERAAQKAGVQVTEAEVDAAVEAQRKDMVQSRFAGNEAAFAAQLERYGLTLAAWERSRRPEARARLLAERTLRAQAGGERLEALFELRYGPGGVDRKVSHLLISTHVATSRFYTREQFDAERERVRAEAKAQAEALRKQIAEGADLATLAEAHSDDWSKRRGASLGVGWAGRFGRDFDDAVARLAVGEVSAVIESRKGFHVARVDGVQKGARYSGAYILASARATSPDDPRDEAARRAATKEKAAALRARLEGGADFAQVAKAESDDPVTAPRGGDLGSFAPGRLGPEVDAVLETLPLNTVSQPLDVGDGYVLVRLDNREFLPGEDRKLVSHILIGTTYPKVKARRLAEGLEDRARAKADALLAEAQKPDADFGALAREHSEDELSRRAGGRLGRHRPGALGPEADAALAVMKVGDVRLVASPKGIHLVRLDAEVKTELDAVRAELAAELADKPVRDADIEAFVEKLRAEARVERDL